MRGLIPDPGRAWVWNRDSLPVTHALYLIFDEQPSTPKITDGEHHTILQLANYDQWIYDEGRTT
jgi:hypothetical protein